MNTFFAHIAAFIKAKGAAIVHAWPGFVAVALLALNGVEVKAAAVIGAIIHAILQYFHFDGSTVTPPAPASTSAAAPVTAVTASDTAQAAPLGQAGK